MQQQSCPLQIPVTSNTTAITSNTVTVTSNTTAVMSNTVTVTSNTTAVTSNTVTVTSNTTAVMSNTVTVTSNTTAVMSNTVTVTSNTTAVMSSTVTCPGVWTQPSFQWQQRNLHDMGMIAIKFKSYAHSFWNNLWEYSTLLKHWGLSSPKGYIYIYIYTHLFQKLWKQCHYMAM